VATWSDASVGDLRPPAAAPGPHALDRWAARQAGAEGRVVEVHWAHQVHGTGVVTVPDPGRGGPPGLTTVAEGPGDALVSASPAVALAVLTADCASVALGSPEGVFGAVHAGWRGLAGGVVQQAVAAMRSLGATQVVGALGPCIHPECYEFSEDDLDAVCAAVGETARGHTTDGRPALDVPAAVAAALASSGATEVVGDSACTACGGGYFSHRRRGDTGRQALLVWTGAASGAAGGVAVTGAARPAP
jgi:YfiH family protein